MSAALKIIAGVVEYRLRKLEMANLAAAVSIAVVLHAPSDPLSIPALFGMPWLDVFVRTVFAFLNNDYIDIGIDLKSADKDATKSRFLAEHLKSALYAQWMLVAVLAVFALAYDPGLLVALIAGGGICVWYSWKLKAKPLLDIWAMMVWGVTMPLVGSPAESALGWALALQLGLFSGVFESIQVMRDADEDAEEGVRTTAVVFGKARTLLLARVLMVACTAYALLVMHPLAAVISVAALLVPFAENAIERYWTRVKLAYGIAWLAICAVTFLQGRTGGLLWSVDQAARLF
jgi:4-hydroxybenzoate polyprenyltransferase